MRRPLFRSRLFSLNEDYMTVSFADVFSRVRRCNRTRKRRSGLAVVVSRRAVWIMKTKRAVVKRIHDKWKRMRVRFVRHALLPGASDDAEILVLENHFIDVRVGLIARRCNLRTLGSRSIDACVLHRQLRLTCIRSSPLPLP
jgi:hypothetical protein